MLLLLWICEKVAKTAESSQKSEDKGSRWRCTDGSPCSVVEDT
jgi:hypothetical protein